MAQSKQTKLGIDVKKYENYSEWYSQVSHTLAVVVIELRRCVNYR